MTTVIDICRIPPPPGVAADLKVPLAFMDFMWLRFHPIRRLLFYNHPCSEPDFMEAIVPKLKQSLSLTLKHYLVVAANLLYPSDTDRSRPLLRYVSGDSVQLKIAISGQDFDDLAGSRVRDSDRFYDFIPDMPPEREEGEYRLFSLIARQATLFPGRGICIGVSNHHSLGDARSVVGFMWAWAEINKFGGDEEFTSRNAESLPFFDRSVLGDCGRINDMYWDILKNMALKQSSFPLPTNRVRSSFTLSQSDIQNLKNLVLSSNHGVSHSNVSSFVVTAAYVWSCVMKSADGAGVDEPELFFFAADGRGRPNALVEPPVPLNYFGNFLGGGMVNIKHGIVAADDGFVAAAAVIADQIKNQINNKHNFLNDVDRWLSRMSEIMKSETFGVSGSPKFDMSKADFGWGNARRLEVLSMDEEKYSMSLCNSFDSGGGFVIGLSLPAERMEAFALIFENGLKSSVS